MVMKAERVTGLLVSLALELAGLGLASVGFGCSGTAGDRASTVPAKNGPKTAALSDAHLDGHALLAADAAIAITAGAGPLQVLGADIASEGDRLGGFVDIPADDCLLAFARPSPTIGDVDLFAYEDDGTPFSSDESPNQGGTVLVCPPHPRRLYVVARVMAGAGLLTVGVQGVPAKNADAVARAVRAGSPGRGHRAPRRVAGARIEGARASRRGGWALGRRRRVAVAAHAARHLADVDHAGAERCADILMAPSEEVASLDAVIEDARGRVAARARERGRDRSAVVCSAERAEISVAMRPRASQGLVAVVVARSANSAGAEVLQPTFVSHVTQTLEFPRRAPRSIEPSTVAATERASSWGPRRRGPVSGRASRWTCRPGVRGSTSSRASRSGPSARSSGTIRARS